MAKKYGVVGITKKENAQLGLLLKHLDSNKDKYSFSSEVLPYPEALVKLISRYRWQYAHSIY